MLYEDYELSIFQCALAFEMYIYQSLEVAVQVGKQPN